MSNKASKVPSNNTVPRWAFAVIEGLLDVLGNVLLNVVLLHSFLRDLDGLALHLFAHVGGLHLGWEVLARLVLESCSLAIFPHDSPIPVRLAGS